MGLDGSAQFSEWTKQMVAGFGVFSESGVSVAFPLSPSPEQHSTASGSGTGIRKFWLWSHFDLC